jgi:predicted transcriptional regulator
MTMAMRKTSVYLDDALAERLAVLAREEGRPQSEVLRDAIAGYRPRFAQDRDFAMAGAGRGDGSSVADVSEDDLLAGFGE